MLADAEEADLPQRMGRAARDHKLPLPPSPPSPELDNQHSRFAPRTGPEVGSHGNMQHTPTQSSLLLKSDMAGAASSSPDPVDGDEAAPSVEGTTPRTESVDTAQTDRAQQSQTSVTDLVNLFILENPGSVREEEMQVIRSAEIGEYRAALDIADKVKKADVDPHIWRLMTDYAFRRIRQDKDKFPFVYKATVDYLASTNVFTAVSWSCWGGQKRVQREIEKLKNLKERYPDYEFTLAPDISLAALAVIELRPRCKAHTSKTFIALREEKVWGYLHQAVEVVETFKKRTLGGKFVVLGIKGLIDASKPSLLMPRQEHTTAHTATARPKTGKMGAGAALVPVPEMLFSKPYPSRMATTTTITADEWETRHGGWLNEIPRRVHVGRATYTNTIEKEVTKETVPLIRERHRDAIFIWLSREKPGSAVLDMLDDPFAESIKTNTTIEGFVEETDLARQTIRDLEGLIFQLHSEDPDTAMQMKTLTDRLFAYRDYQLDSKEEAFDAIRDNVRNAMADLTKPRVDAATLDAEFNKAQSGVNKRLAVLRKAIAKKSGIADLQ
ncbi:hypothetical protein ACHAPT_000291 [Fusarium lateritium]